MSKLFNPSRAFFLKIVISLVLFCVLIISVISFILNDNDRKCGLGIVNEANTNMLSQISFSENYMHDTAKTFAFSLFFNDQFLPLLYAQTEDYDDDIIQLRHVASAVDLAPFVHSVYFYNQFLDKYVSTWKSTFGTSKTFFDQEIVERMSNLSDRDRAVPILRKMPINEDLVNQLYVNVYTYIIYDTPDVNKGVKGAVIVNIKSDYLTELIASMNSKTVLKDSQTFIINQQGHVVNANNQGLFLHNWSNETYVRKILTSGMNKGYFLDRVNGKPMMINYVSSDVLGWKFVSMVSYEEVLRNIRQIQTETAVISAVILLVAILVAYSLSRYLYSPIQKLVNRVSQMNIAKRVGGAEMDEVGYIVAAFVDQYEKTQILESKQRNDLYLKKTEILRSCLLNDRHDPEKLSEQFSEYKILFDINKRYVVCLFKIDHYYTSFVNQFNSQDGTLLRYAIGNIAGETIAAHFSNDYVDMGEDRVVVLINIGDDSIDKTHSTLKGCIAKVQGFVNQYIKLSLSAAVSYVGVNQAEIHRCYNEVNHIIKYRFSHGHGSILFPESLKNLAVDGFNPPAELETELLKQINLGQHEETTLVFVGILQAISNSPYDSIMAYLNYLAHLIYHKCNLIDSGGMDTIALDYVIFTREMNRLETMDEIKGKFVELFEHIFHRQDSIKKNRNFMIIDTISKIVKSNYSDKSLCLEYIANTINMSKNYIGKLFKDHHGISVAEYITDLRLAMAMELVKDGRHSIESIVEQIGMDNKNYFYRLFKAKYGYSTSEFKFKYNKDTKDEA